MSQNRHPGKAANPPRRRRNRFAVTAAFILLGIGVTLFLTQAILVHRAGSILRTRVINTLSTRFQGHVELPEFHVSIWRGFEAEGRNLKIYPDALPQQQPLFAVGAFHFHTLWWNLLRSPMHVGDITVSELAINMPPSEQRHGIPGSRPPGEKGRKQKIEIIVDRIEIHHAQLVLGTDKPGKEPMIFNIQNLLLHNVGTGQPMRFHATLINPKPIGAIDSTGTFGPFNVTDAGASPVTGSYTFSHADLNTIKGIGGILSSSGRYTGRLNRITVDGATDTPDFSIDLSGHPVPLRTRFHAIVDGTSGDTDLQPVDAWLGRSHILARGSVERVKGQGHHIRLQVKAGPDAGIQDMLALAVKTQPPLLHGPIELTTTLDLPPGKARVTDRLRLKGMFAISHATFTDPAFQSKVDQLSLRARGEPKKASAAAKAGVRIQSVMRGSFALDNAKMTITGLDYKVPGADIAMDGEYSMDRHRFDFHGKLRLTAKLSQTVSDWWKKILLKPLDPIFAKNGVGTEIPIRVSGTKGSPNIGLDFGHRQPAAGKSR